MTRAYAAQLRQSFRVLDDHAATKRIHEAVRSAMAEHPSTTDGQDEAIAEACRRAAEAVLRNIAREG